MGTNAFGFFPKARLGPSSHPHHTSANPTTGYATDIATTSANSGAITAALKTPTADIRYAPITDTPPKYLPRVLAPGRDERAPGAQSRKPSERE